MSTPDLRTMVRAASGVRLAYALGLLLAPVAMGKAGLGPETDENPYATMTTRAFGAVHTNVAALTMRAAEARDVRLALRLNIGCDLGDLVATLLAWRKDEVPGRVALGSTVVQCAGIASWAALLRRTGTA